MSMDKTYILNSVPAHSSGLNMVEEKLVKARSISIDNHKFSLLLCNYFQIARKSMRLPINHTTRMRKYECNYEYEYNLGLIVP